MRPAILLTIITPAFAVALEPLDRFKPKEPAPLAKEKAAKPEPNPSAAKAKHGGEQTGLKLRGLVFVPGKSQVRSDGVKGVDGVRAEGVPFIDRPDFTGRMQKFIGQFVSLDLVNAIAAETVRYFSQHDRPVLSVVAPKQDVTSGVVQFVLTEARVGEIRVAGNKHFRTDQFKVGLHPGDPILMSELELDTALYGRNPFRSVSAELSPGKHSGETDITLRVQDRFPLRVFAGWDNSGVKSTDESRLFAGFNYGNVFGLGDEFSYQFSASPDFEKLLAHSATWTLPLPWHHIFQVSATYAGSRPNIGPGFALQGQSWQVGAHYIIPLRGTGRFSHELNIGFDFKSTDNNLQFGGVQVFRTPVEIAEFSLGYSGMLKDKWGSTSLALAGYWSPGGIGGHNDTADFVAARGGSTADYCYVSLGMDRVTKLPLGFSWALSAQGQISSGNLQSTEQFLLGGHATVRGYDELAAAGDQGLLMRNEIHAPAFSVGRLVGCRRAQDQLQLLVFHDIGRTEVKHALIGENKGITLQSAGIGARWQLKSNISAYFDYGWQIDDIGLRDNSRGHVGVTVSY